ncbi:MAG: aspartate carbamoyltransferase regulatory subunit [Methanosarcinales archaeon Met12]|nr:MAG: aspartate carbamoyltransferase regulatory subunit [Methanosarcinales archaeon Met12]
MKKNGLYVRPIQNGTVIDHITAGQALSVLRILGINRTTEEVVSVVMNVTSKAIGTKDIVKIEGRELKPSEVDKIALIAPSASINIIRKYNVAGKHKVDIPDEIEGVVRCANPNCISNTIEPVVSRFTTEKQKTGIQLRCIYCERIISENIVEHLL